MNINELNRINEAPANGQLLLYRRKEKIEFRKYSTLESVMGEYADEEILEIHLFDKTKEYRAVCSESPRFSAGFIETVSDFREEDSFIEEVFLESGDGRIKVLNHLSYDANTGMAFIDDYRLVPGGEK